jgi:hypothetical protein
VTGDGHPPDRRQVTEHDRARLRTVHRIALAGPVLGLLAALVLGTWGVGGAAGLAVVLVVSAAAAVLAAFVAALGAIVDEARRVPVARRRTWTALALFAGAFVLLLLSTGVTATV